MKLAAPWEYVFSVVEPQINAAGVHRWPFNPLFPIDVRHFVGSGHHASRMNRHEYLEIAYVSDGGTNLEVQDRSIPVSKGDVIVIGPNLYHTYVSSPELRVVCLYFQPDLVWSGDHNDETAEYLRSFLRQGPDFPHVVPSNSGISAEIFEWMRRIHAELPAESNRGRLAVRTYLKLILVLLLNHYSMYPATQGAFNRVQRSLDRLHPVFELIENRYQGRILVHDAARSCGMSSSRLMPFFKATTGQTFLVYLNHFRIAKAQVLLFTTDMSISEISDEVGFCDQSHFGVLFRKVVGLSPLKYRSHLQQAEAKPLETTSEQLDCY